MILDGPCPVVITQPVVQPEARCLYNVSVQLSVRYCGGGGVCGEQGHSPRSYLFSWGVTQNLPLLVRLLEPSGFCNGFLSDAI